MEFERLAVWPSGWELIGYPDDNSYLALRRGEDGEPEENAQWFLSDEEDLATRKTIFADLLERMVTATIVDTEHLSGIVIDISGYDYDQVGNARGIYVFKNEETESTYDQNAEELSEVVEAMKNYTPTDTAETEDTQ